MNRIVKMFSIFIALFIIFQYSIISNAADEQSNEQNTRTEIVLKTNSTEFKSGEEIKVYIYMQSVKFDDGIAYIEGNIEYDSDILEPITTNDTTYNGWTSLWNTETGKISIDRGNLTSNKQEVAELTFKLKQDITSGTNINFTNIKVMNDFEEDEAEDVSLQLGKSQSDNDTNKDNDDDKDNDSNIGNNEEDKNNDDNKTPSNSDDNNNIDGSTDKDDKKQDSQKQDNVDNANRASIKQQNSSKIPDNSQTINSIIPKTGLNGWIMILICIVGILGIISYNKYRKYKNI